MEQRTSETRQRRNRHQSLAMAAAFIGVLFFTIALPGIATAHSPKEVALSYDPPSGNLQVTITHSSPFPNIHYIKRVEISLNGKVLNSFDYQGQPDKPTFAYIYAIKATAGDTLEASASCSLFGSKTGRLTIPK
jgi:hypothetical protein